MTVTSAMPNLYTGDMDRALAFYHDLLGGILTFRTAEQGTPVHVELRLGDVIIALSSRDAVPAQGLPPPTTGHPMELVVACDSTDEAVTALRAAGTPILVEPYSHPSGHRRAYVTDPDGNWIALASR